MRVSASNVWRLRECAYWARDGVPWSEESGEAADLGTAVHSLIEHHFRMQERGFGSLAREHVIPIPVGVDRMRAERLADVYVEWFNTHHQYGRRWESEISFAYDIATDRGRVLGVGLGRKYEAFGLSPTEIAMTADLATRDGEAEIRDVKTGRQENEDAAYTNTQLATLGLAWQAVTGMGHKIRVALDFVQPFGVVPDEAVFDTYDLDAWAEELRELTARIPTSVPTPGSHCKYCPAVSACPATTGALARMAPSEAIDTERRRLPIVMSADAIQDEEHARHQYLTLRAAKAAIDRAWGAVRGYVDQHGAIDLGGGRAYATRETKRESIDLSDPKAVAILREQLGDDFALAVSYDTSKTAIKEAARAIAPKTNEKLVQIERRVLDALRDAGAVRTSTSTTYDEIEAPKAIGRKAS